MNPISFPEVTKELQKPANMTDEECGPLPVFNDGAQSISCWQMTWRERLSALFFGRVWLCVAMGPTQPPVWLEAKKTVFEKPKEYHVGRVKGLFLRAQSWIQKVSFSIRVFTRRFER